jgi:hypothetical protein
MLGTSPVVWAAAVAFLIAEQVVKTRVSTARIRINPVIPQKDVIVRHAVNKDIQLCLFYCEAPRDLLVGVGGSIEM